MPRPSYSLHDIEDFYGKGLLTREERMLLRQDYYQQSTRDPTIVETIGDAVMTPIRIAQKFLDDQARELKEKAAANKRERQERERLFAERARKLQEAPSPVDMALDNMDEQLRQLEVLKAARDLPKPQPKRPLFGQPPINVQRR
jgi:hypothetical protein